MRQGCHPHKLSDDGPSVKATLTGRAHSDHDVAPLVKNVAINSLQEELAIQPHFW